WAAHCCRQGRAFPDRSPVTRLAIGAEPAQVNLRLRMARDARGRRALERVVRVALLAIDSRVMTRQWECGLVVVERAGTGSTCGCGKRRAFPTYSDVAPRAVGSELPQV